MPEEDDLIQSAAARLNLLENPPVDAPVDTPVDTPPVDTPPVDTPPAVEPPDHFSWLNEKTGLNFSSEEELSRISNIGELETQVTELQGIVTDYEANQVDAYPNQYVEKLAELYRDGATEEQISAFQEVSKFGDLSEMSDFDSMSLELQHKYGLTWQEADARLERQYATRPEHPTYEGLDDEEVQRLIADAKIDQKVASTESRGYLEELQVDISTIEDPEAGKELVAKQNHEKYVQGVQPLVAKIGKDFKGIIGDLGKDSKGEAVNFNFQADKAFLDNLSPMVTQYAVQNQIDYHTNEGQQQVLDYAKLLYKLEHYDRDVKTAYQHGQSKAVKAKAEEYHNAGPVTRGDQVEQVASDKDAFTQWREKQFGKR